VTTAENETEIHCNNCTIVTNSTLSHQPGQYRGVNAT
jgi:hypothetical protein